MNNLINFFAVWVEGIGYKVGVEEVKIPSVKDKGEDFRGGGMQSDMDMPLGIEKLSASFMMTTFDIALLRKAGLKLGAVNRITMRGNLVSENGEPDKAVIAIIEGRMSAEPKPWKSGSKSGVEYPITSIKYYKLTIDGERVYEIVPEGLVRGVGEEDQLEQVRSNLGF